MTTTFVEGVAASKGVPTTTQSDSHLAMAPVVPETHVPQTLRLATLSSSAYRLKRHLELELLARGGKAVVRWNSGAIEAEGDVLTEAVDRFRAILVSRADDMPDLIEVVR